MELDSLSGQPIARSPHEAVTAYLGSLGKTDQAPVANSIVDLLVHIRGTEEGAAPLALVCWLLLSSGIPRFVVDRVVLAFSKVPAEQLAHAMVGVLDNEILCIQTGSEPSDVSFYRLPDFAPVSILTIDPLVSLTFSVGTAQTRLG